MACWMARAAGVLALLPACAGPAWAAGASTPAPEATSAGDERPAAAGPTPPAPAAAPAAAESPASPPESTATPAAPAPDSPSAAGLTARQRVEFHLERVRTLGEHFRKRLEEPCPRFTTAGEWDRFLDGEVAQAVILTAHAKEASAIARRSREEALVRTVAGFESRIEEARGLAEKLEACARDNGTNVDFVALAKRVRREVPKRRAEIRLSR